MMHYAHRDDKGRRLDLFGPDRRVFDLGGFTSHPIGLLIVAGLAIILAIGIPVVFFFLVGLAVVAIILFPILWWKNR